MSMVCAARAGGLSLALVPLLVLAGCYEVSSKVPAVTEASRAAELPTSAGRYCSVSVYLDDQGAVDVLELDDCFSLAADGGILTLTPDEADPPLVLDVAALTRGAHLLQYRDAETGDYRLLVAFMRQDAVAVLDEPYLTPAIASAAEREGVALAREETAEADEDEEIDILDGEPDAVLALMREAAGLTFDAALRDEELGRDLVDDAIFYVRVGSGADDENRDQAAAREKVLALEQMIERAMALE